MNFIFFPLALLTCNRSGEGKCFIQYVSIYILQTVPVVCHHPQNTLYRSREAGDGIGEPFNILSHQLETALTPTLAVDSILQVRQQWVCSLNSLPGDGD